MEWLLYTAPSCDEVSTWCLKEIGIVCKVNSHLSTSAPSIASRSTMALITMKRLQKMIKFLQILLAEVALKKYKIYLNNQSKDLKLYHKFEIKYQKMLVA